MTTRKLLAMTLILCSFAAANASQLSMMGGIGFGAPNVNGVGNATNPEIGDIIFDTSLERFAGFAGDTPAPGWITLGGSAASSLATPTVQKFTSSSGTYNSNYTFFVNPVATASAGDTYTNNGVTFTVYADVTSSNKIVLRGSGAPTSAGNLVISSGSGSSTIAFYQALAPLYIRVIAAGGGGGGGGGGSGHGAGGGGGNTTFDSLTAAAGTGGSSNGGTTGAGGTASLPSGIFGTALSGAPGGAGWQAASAINVTGGSGGNNALGGGGVGTVNSGVGNAAVANTGGGGGGGVGGGAVSGGSGGGAGAYLNVIYPMAATYSYAIGSAGSAGAGAQGGGAGGSGYIEVQEYYQ